MDLFSKKVIETNFGGSQKKGNPKTARPVSTKQLMHVVLKSDKAVGSTSFLRFERNILVLAKNLSLNAGVQIKDMVVMGNHIHIALKCNRRGALTVFLRALCGIIARKVLSAEKGTPSSIQGFFSGRPFSRIVAIGRKSYLTIRDYFQLNRLEKLGWSQEAGRNLLAGRNHRKEFASLS